MPLTFQILGKPGEDNALLVRVDTGKSIHRLLLDCGEQCLDGVGISEIQCIDHLFFSHFHMDHVSGFDRFFRHNYNREKGVVHVWGPPDTAEVIGCRMHGYTWNLHHDQPGDWRVHSIAADCASVHTTEFRTCEGFEPRPGGVEPIGNVGALVHHRAFRVEVRALNHGSIPSMAYKVIESDKVNIDPEKLRVSGLPPGPWINTVRDAAIPGSESVDIEGEAHSLEQLRSDLLVGSKGASLAYLTDFHFPDPDQRSEIVDWLQGTDQLVCEAQYREADEDFANRNAHMTTRSVGELARDAGVGELILQHLSRRYPPDTWSELLAEAQAVFANTRFPAGWLGG